MPFIRRDPTSGTEKRSAGAARTLEDLRSEDGEARWTAARALGGDPQDLPALAAALAVEPTARVREALMTAIVRIGGEASVAALTLCMRSQNAAMRAAAIDALQAMPEAILPFMPALLADADSDVRILATELARKLPSQEATRLLSDLLEREPHPNVCAAAIEVLAEAGTSEAVPALRACAERFAGAPFLPFAVSVAIAALSETRE
jgi:HEAT repeat protein